MLSSETWLLFCKILLCMAIMQDVLSEARKSSARKMAKSNLVATATGINADQSSYRTFTNDSTHSPIHEDSGSDNSVGLQLGLGLGIFFLIITCCIASIAVYRRWQTLKRETGNHKGEEEGVKDFDLNNVEDATDNEYETILDDSLFDETVSKRVHHQLSATHLENMVLTDQPTKGRRIIPKASEVVHVCQDIIEEKPEKVPTHTMTDEANESSGISRATLAQRTQEAKPFKNEVYDSSMINEMKTQGMDESRDSPQEDTDFYDTGNFTRGLNHYRMGENIYNHVVCNNDLYNKTTKQHLETGDVGLYSCVKQ